MKKRIVSIITALVIWAALVPAHAENAVTFWVSDGFSSYADNASAVNDVIFDSGIDTRVINDGGEKVLYTRAFGEGISLQVQLPAANVTKSVFSARIKAKGEHVTGSLFAATDATGKQTFINVTDGIMTLHDGRRVGALTGIYQTITIVSDWKTKTFDMFVDKKCVADDWFMPSTSRSFPKLLEFIFDYDGSEIELYMDDLRVYSGGALPWEISFPAESINTEVLPFDITTEIDTSSEILNSVEFNTGTAGVTIVQQNGGTTALGADDDGTGYLLLYANETSPSSAYIDLTNSDLQKKKRYVVDMRFMVCELSGGAAFGFFDNKNSDGAWRLGYDIDSSLRLISHATGGKVTEIPQNEWTRFTVCFNIPDGIAKMYINGEYIGSHSISTSYYATMFRLDIINKIGGVHKTKVDYLRVYTGEEPLPESYFDDAGSKVDLTNTKSLPTIMDPADKLEKALDDKVVFMMNNDTMYIDGIKQSYFNESFKPYIIDGITMMPRNMFSLFSNEDITYDEASGEITIGERAVLKTGETRYLLNGKEALLSAAPKLENGTVYFPLRSVAEQVLGKNVVWDNRGFIVISSKAIEVTRSRASYMDTLKGRVSDDVTDFAYLDRQLQWRPMDLIYRYMQFDNPTGAQIIEDLIKNNPKKKHPRLIFGYDDVEYILDKVAGDKEWERAYNNIIDTADGLINKEYGSVEDIQDSNKQQTATTFNTAMTAISTAYILTGDEKYASKGVEILKSHARWKTTGSSSSNLTMGDWCTAMALGFDAFYNYMAKSEKGREDMKFLKERILELPFKDNIMRYCGANGAGWAQLTDNFVGYIAGGLTTLALAVADEEDMRDSCEYILENVLKSLYVAAELYFPNGGYYESVSYSDYAFDNLLPALEALFNCCGTDYGISNAKGFKKAGDFFTYAQSTLGQMGFHDGWQQYQNNPVREFMSYRYGDASGAEAAMYQKKLACVQRDLKSLYYYEKTKESGNSISIENIPLDNYFYGAEAGSFTNSREISGETFAAFHGGWTGIPHDSLDLGTFMFESDGVKWVCDLGINSNSYGLPDYFGYGGYKLYRKRPEGENCMVFNPKNDGSSYYGQKVGAYAPLVLLEQNAAGGGMAAYDLTEPYERDVEKYIRGYYFGDNRNTFTVRDEVKLKSDAEIYWFAHTAANIEIINNTTARLTSDDGKKSCTVEIICSTPDYTLERMECAPLPSSPTVDGQPSNEGFEKLAVHIPNASDEVVLTVKYSPDRMDYTKTEITQLPILQWTAPKGEKTDFPMLSELTVDGQIIENFLPGKRNYNVSLPYGTEKVPVVSAHSDDGTVKVEQSTSFDTPAKITLSTPKFGDIEINVSFSVSKEKKIYVKDNLSEAVPVIGAVGNLIVPVSGKGGTLPEPENPPENMFDNNFDTRATQSGFDKWFEMDLGEVKDIDGIAVSYYDGNLRRFQYDLLYSEDGVNFTRVFHGESTGLTNDYETVEIPGRVRYIRYVGYGNSTSTWNSITEFRAFKR